MIVWRLTAQEFAHQVISGEGARLFGGRWNRQGLAAVYTAEHLSLAVLEWLVNVDSDLAPARVVGHRIDIPDNLSIDHWTKADLPAEWSSYPVSQRIVNRGSQWLESRHAVGLSVPSAVLPIENCIILNPEHSDFKKVRVIEHVTIEVDERLF